MVKSRLTGVLGLLFAAAAALGVEHPAVPGGALPDPSADGGVRVAVLGYHEFSDDQPPSAMRIKTGTFREQMEAIRNLDLSVISHEDFIAWKRGLKTIPQRSVLITIDDGWKSVYTDAYPILREFGYPFTVYLYTNYVDGGGRALTTAMVREMQQHGCSVGSHSVSHPFPATVKRHAKEGPEALERFLRKEMGSSKRFLEERFGSPVITYSYPGGYHTDEMFPIADEFGYEFLFTVTPGKVKASSDPRVLPRYMVLGNYPRIFEMATSFRAVGGAAPLLGYQKAPHPVKPEPGGLIESRLPVIVADLSGVENLDPDTLVMRVSGFGKVPASFDSAASTCRWQVDRHLRQRICEVTLSWRLKDRAEFEPPMRWSFQVDREAAYQSRGH
jgi:peptidoglycan/xylan/chitin deacetylase (PgdA/CDA1 family)